MTAVIWIIVALALTAFVLETGFFALATAKRVEGAGVKLTGYRRAVIYVWLLIGVPADFIYNVIVGTIVFRELPQEWMYSSRIGRLARAGNPKAIKEAEFLNSALPGHIRLE